MTALVPAIAAQPPLLLDLTVVAFILHIAGGTIGLLSGSIAIVAKKGARLHRIAGTVFFVSMLVMAVFAAFLAVVRPGQILNLFIATFAFYLIATAWMTVRRKAGTIGLFEKIAFVVILCLCAPFALLSLQMAAGLAPSINSAFPIRGPVLIALYSFTLIIGIATVSDARMILAGGIAGPARIARHPWRMCLGLTLAAGSAFTNGLPRLLPGPMHVTPIFFIPQFVPVLFLIFWMIRVRFAGRFHREAVA